MGESWVVPPETCRLPLTDGHWLLVKARLNAGEYFAHLRRSSTVDADGVRRIDFLEHAVSLVQAYLVEWSVEPSLRGTSDADKRAALDAIDPDQFRAISQAVQAHEAAQETARAKKKRETTTGAEPTSPLPFAVAGASTGSAP